MMRTAITGGIGSGKSHVCHLLAKRGIRVYDCDAAAKRLMRSDELRQQLTRLVGDGLYINNVLQKAMLAKFLLASEANKQAVNTVVHPAVARDFMQSDYQWLESAILFDSGFDRRVPFDRIVCVTAPTAIRVERIMQRDNITREKALEWINCQMPQDEMARRSDFVINNDGKEDLEKQIDKILNHQ
jgi:dephospho-CoA kinase